MSAERTYRASQTEARLRVAANGSQQQKGRPEGALSESRLGSSYYPGVIPVSSALTRRVVSSDVGVSSNNQPQPVLKPQLEHV
jgi:hypothetical protein